VLLCEILYIKLISSHLTRSARIVLVLHLHLKQNIMGNSGIDREVVESSRRLLVFLQQRFGIFADVQAAAQFDSFSTADIPLSAFELCEDDQPVVVPYDEVVAVLGTHALNSTETIDYATTADDDVVMTAQHFESATSSSSGANSTQLQPTAAAAAAVVNTSASASTAHDLQQHSSARSRWQEMNALLDEVNVSNLSIKQSQHQPVMSVAKQYQQQQYSAKLVAAYPALFAAVNSSVGEDVVMTAVRLVSTEQTASASERAAQSEAVAFLEQEVSSDSSELWSQLHAQPAAS
jgi:hypothetical protein